MNATLTRIADRIDRGITDHTDADALRAMLGKPAPMLQDCDRKLSAWLASTPHARQHAIEAAAAIAQQPVQARQPLTDDAILDAYCKAPDMRQYITAFKAGARFAENAHGIGDAA